MSIPSCIFTDLRIPCESYNRTFRSQSCLNKNSTNKMEGKTVCAQKRNRANCGSLLDPNHKHECFNPYCTICQQNREIGHLCYMKPLSNELPRSDNVLLVFYDFETTQDTKFSDAATVHIPNLVSLQRCSLISR